MGQRLQKVKGTEDVRLQSAGSDWGRYSHFPTVLKRADKWLVLRYLGRTTGYSPQSLTRLVRQCLAIGWLTKRYCPPPHGFARKDTVTDVALLAETDALHDTLSGPGTRQLTQRAGLRGHPLCAAGVDLGGTSLRSAGRRRLPGAPRALLKWMLNEITCAPSAWRRRVRRVCTSRD